MQHDEDSFREIQRISAKLPKQTVDGIIEGANGTSGGLLPQARPR